MVYGNFKANIFNNFDLLSVHVQFRSPVSIVFIYFSTEAVAVSGDMLKTSSMKMMLKYIFKYFVQSLQEGSNQNLSSELLNEAVALFAGIPDVLLFKEIDESKGLIGSLDQAFQFMVNFITR